jgi:hypothetical protein
MKHLSEEDLILIYYGEPGTPEGAQAHLADCGQCKAAADSLAETLNLCNDWSVPAPPPEFERRTWSRLVSGIENTPRGWSIPRVWIAIAAALMLMAGGFVMGRRSSSPKPSIIAGLSTQARERILEISLADHLDRAGMLLTEISNTGESSPMDFTMARGRAQDLVEEGQLMRQTLAHQGESATLTFLDEVERFLLEVANAPDSMSPGEVRKIKQRIGAGSLLFKVRIIESNLRTQGQKL